MTTPFDTLYHYILDSVLVRADLIVTDPMDAQPVAVTVMGDTH